MWRFTHWKSGNVFRNEYCAVCVWFAFTRPFTSCWGQSSFCHVVFTWEYSGDLVLDSSFRIERNLHLIGKLMLFSYIFYFWIRSPSKVKYAFMDSQAYAWSWRFFSLWRIYNKLILQCIHSIKCSLKTLLHSHLLNSAYKLSTCMILQHSSK